MSLVRKTLDWKWMQHTAIDEAHGLSKLADFYVFFARGYA
jgi:hypothetical protein